MALGRGGNGALPTDDAAADCDDALVAPFPPVDAETSAAGGDVVDIILDRWYCRGGRSQAEVEREGGRRSSCRMDRGSFDMVH